MAEHVVAADEVGVHQETLQADTVDTITFQKNLSYDLSLAIAGSMVIPGRVARYLPSFLLATPDEVARAQGARERLGG
ncbi:MAG TPA: hypothetical protein VD761_07765 [Solirubrobacterales bacterium]|nr:hypothetical protein [Solirubrobacterales bacterium]